MREFIWAVLALCIAFGLLVAGMCFGAYTTRQEEREEAVSRSAKHMRDYQIDLYMDTVWVYDGQRLVGTYLSNWQGQIDSIILKDNQ